MLQQRLIALHRRIAGLEGWPRRGTAFAAGAISVLALAPFFIWPVLFLTLPVLVFLIDGASEGSQSARSSLLRAAGAGWWFGFGYFGFGLFWMGEAFLVDAATFGWLLPVAVTAMPAGLSLFWAGATAAAWRFSSPGLARLLMLAATLGIAEWLRGHILTGLPWNVLGYSLTAGPTMMQSASVLGIYGLTLWAVVVFAGPGVMAAQGGSTKYQAYKAIGLAIVPLAIMAGFGSYQLSRPVDGPVEGVRLRIVQPSIPQRDKWLAEKQRGIFDLHLLLSQTNGAGERKGLDGITHVIWPEAAMPFFPLEQQPALDAIAEMLSANQFLITGALRREPKPEFAGRGGVLPHTAYDFYNAMMVFEGGVKPLTGAGQIYDKIHLVPFGEYLPFQTALEAVGLEQLTRLRGGFAFGPSPRPLLQAGALSRIGPLICYEAIFPAAVVQGSERPQLLINVTNDGWFGTLTGPYQHLQQTQVRAVEEGLPLVRAANNGVSAIIDADGRLLQKLGLNAVGVIDTHLPAARPPTVYARFGDLLFFVNTLIFIILSLVISARGRRSTIAHGKTI